jgi:predicted membrane channel-forming protein YqfA (hemolysin III family)
MDNEVSKSTLWETTCSEASGFYYQTLTISTAFLGGSMVFLDKIAPDPIPWTCFFLCLGWICLLKTIHLLLQIRLTNLHAFRLGLEEKWDECAIVVKPNEVKTTIMTKWIMWGLVFITFFGLLNIFLGSLK